MNFVLPCIFKYIHINLYQEGVACEFKIENYDFDDGGSVGDECKSYPYVGIGSDGYGGEGSELW